MPPLHLPTAGAAQRAQSAEPLRGNHGNIWRTPNFPCWAPNPVRFFDDSRWSRWTDPNLKIGFPATIHLARHQGHILVVVEYIPALGNGLPSIWPYYACRRFTEMKWRANDTRHHGYIGWSLVPFPWKFLRDVNATQPSREARWDSPSPKPGHGPRFYPGSPRAGPGAHTQPAVVPCTYLTLRTWVLSLAIDFDGNVFRRCHKVQVSSAPRRGVRASTPPIIFSGQTLSPFQSPSKNNKRSDGQGPDLSQPLRQEAQKPIGQWRRDFSQRGFGMDHAKTRDCGVCLGSCTALDAG